MTKEYELSTLNLDLKGLFQESVKVIMDEMLKETLFSHKNLAWMEKMFMQIMMDKKILQNLLALKKWDAYSYYHSFHVFYLGTYLAKNLKIGNIFSFSLGCLLHDIGKLYVPQEILQKSSKLTIEEFKLVQQHTLAGVRWLEEQSIPEKHYLSKLIKMHHERLDGTGYPEKLQGAQIPYEVRVLMIVDVLSALTLKRVYRDPLSISSALELLLGEPEKYDLSIIHSIVGLLNIFPNEYLEQLEVFCKSRKKRDWNAYILALLNGSEFEALEKFERLSDGLRIEEIYMDVIGNSLQEISHLRKKGKINVVEEQIAFTITREILDMKLAEYYRRQAIKGKILLTTVGAEQQALPLKIIADALLVNGWQVFNVEKSVPLDDLMSFISKHNIEYIGFFINKPKNKQYLEKAVNKLKEVLPNITIVAGGQALINTQKITNIDYIVKDVKEAVHTFALI